MKKLILSMCFGFCSLVFKLAAQSDSSRTQHRNNHFNSKMQHGTPTMYHNASGNGSMEKSTSPDSMRYNQINQGSAHYYHNDMERKHHATRGTKGCKPAISK